MKTNVLVRQCSRRISERANSHLNVKIIIRERVFLQAAAAVAGPYELEELDEGWRALLDQLDDMLLEVELSFSPLCYIYLLSVPFKED